MIRRRRSFAARARLATGPFLALAAVPALAQGATIEPTAACYVNPSQLHPAPMTIVGSGFVPGDDVEVQGGLTGTTFDTGTVDASGNVSLATTAPLLTAVGPAVQSQPITVEDESGAGTIAMTTVLTANLAFSVTPTYAKPTKPRVYRFSGFASGRRIYAHYLYHRRVVATMAFGRTGAPCGTLKQTRLLFPGGHPRRSAYVVQFDDSKRYHRTATPQVRSRFTFGP